MNDNSFEKITPQNMFDSGNLKILICYLLSALDEAVPATEMAQLFHYEGVSNYFDVQTAIYDLERDGSIEKNDKDLYTVTQKGKTLSYTLKDSVSVTLRNKVYSAVVKMLRRYKTERDTNIEMKKTATGVLLTASEKSGDEVLFSFSLMLPNEAQAAALKKQILNDPKYYYESFIKILTEGIGSNNN